MYAARTGLGLAERRERGDEGTRSKSEGFAQGGIRREAMTHSAPSPPLAPGGDGVVPVPPGEAVPAPAPAAVALGAAAFELEEAVLPPPPPTTPAAWRSVWLRAWRRRVWRASFWSAGSE